MLTVVKAKPIQKSVSEPVDKVNTWPHLMLPEFVSLMAMTAFLIFLSAILQAPLLEEANPNVTPNPAKAPWYFFGITGIIVILGPANCWSYDSFSFRCSSMDGFSIHR